MEAVYVRSDIIEKVKAGRWTPQRAESVGARLGVGPFAHDPDAAVFNPWLFERWPLPMVLAWIAWRDEKHIREAWPEYQAERSIWFREHLHKEDKKGNVITTSTRWDLTTGKVLTILDMIEDQDDDLEAGLMQETILSSWEALKLRLAHGEVRATGLRENNPGGLSPAIEPAEWVYIDLRLDLNADDNPTPPIRAALFDSREIRQFWPPVAKMDPQRLPAHVKMEIAALFRTKVKEWEVAGKPDAHIGERDFERLALSTIGSAKKTWARDIWRRDRPPEWEKRGRRPIALTS